jgi:hypothetical protein
LHDCLQGLAVEMQEFQEFRYSGTRYRLFGKPDVLIKAVLL